MTRTAPEPRARRSVALVVLDVVMGAAFAVIGLVFGLVAVAVAGQIGHVNDGLCTAGPYEGIECDAGALSLLVNALIFVTVIAWALTTGMFVVRLIQRRWAFYWPIIGLVILVVAFYGATAIAGQIAEHA